MDYKEGSMNTEQLKKIFGSSLQVRDDGHVSFSNDGDTDKFMNDSKLRDVFTGAMGRSESDWTDGEKSNNDLGSVVRFLSTDEKNPTSTAPTEQPEFAHSPKVAHAKARLAQHKEDVMSGKTGTDLFGDTASQDAADNFLERYKLKLGKQDDNGNYFQPEQ